MRGASDRMESLAPAGGERGDGRKARRRFQPATVRYSAPPLRPRGVGEVLDLATEVLIARFPPLVGLAFLIWLPVAWIQSRLLSGDPRTMDMSEAMALIALSLGPTLVATMLISAACCRITFRYLWPDDAGRQAFPHLARVLPSLVVVTLVSGLGVALAMPFTCGILSVFLWWRLMFAPCIVVLEAPNPMRAMMRSWELTRAGFWRWIGIFLVSFFYMLPLSLASTKVQGEAAMEGLRDWLPNLGPAGAEAITLAVYAFLLALPSAFSTGVLLTVFYVDAQVRREGLDLTLALETLQEAPRSAPPLGTTSSPADSAPPAGGLA